jgi:hypothetical protein
VQIIPLDDIADAAAFLVIKPLFGSCELECGSRPGGFIAAKSTSALSREELQIAHSEQIDPFGEQAVHKTIPGHHIGHDAGLEALAPSPEQFVYSRKVGL